MTRSQEPLPTSDRAWWVRFSAIAIATSGLCIALAVGLQSRPVPEADASTEKPSQNASTIPPDFHKQKPLKDSDREAPPPPQLPGIFGNVAIRQTTAPQLPPAEPPQSSPVPDQKTDDFRQSIFFKDTPNLPESQPQSPEKSDSPIVEPSPPSRQDEGAIASSWWDGISLPPTLETPVPTLRNSAAALITQTAPEPQQNTLELTQRDVVYLALENNRTIKNQYLERIVQRRALEVAEDEFVPDFTPSLSIEWENIEQSETFSRTAGLVAEARLVMKIPTGGELGMGWRGRGTQVGTDADAESELRQNLELSFQQPLLRGAGTDVNRASIKVARLDEAINILDLKNTLIEQITEAILAYRSLVQAQERLDIQIRSLEAARQQVENTQILIDAGRRPAVDLITAQRGVTNQEVSVLNAENNLKQQQLALLDLLDIELEGGRIPIATEIKVPEAELPDPEEIIEIAFKNRPDYLKAKLEIEKAETRLMVAENNRRWNIDLDTEIRHNATPNILEEQTEFRAGIVFSKTLGDLTIEQEFDRARVNVLQAKNNLEEERQQIDIDVANAVRDVRDNLRQLELRQQLTELREQELNNEEEKIRLGVGDTSIVDLVRFQDDLAAARNAELNAQIDYLNSLTQLEQTLGTTLERWEIVIEQEESMGEESDN
ncbi:TolC family protein [Lyngbya sp. CCY1209]|uniref:TolC family protein n=1 Tax=Lyngbya sp. CCY1209 TaxID=2886103 RepID=UPI002D2000FB|nr:TolC family protein [Lyngbya sp. CCY1209]MEB3884323.1 TolC family protein [Lyngbya sp. CCY1209]